MYLAALAPLAAWGSFYTLIGSAAATLTGLMFVVITLISSVSRERVNRSHATIGAYGTPTVVHFAIALLVAASLAAPWQAFWHISLLLGLIGLGGIIYLVIIIRRVRGQNDYEPVFEDWLWHSIFPFLSYAGLAVAALVLLINPMLALFMVGGITLLFLLTGIHNAWDTVTYIVMRDSQP